MTDGELLDRFLTGQGHRAEIAFEALVIRHGPMVWGVCHRVLTDPADADDAFQATFMVLVRRARSVRVDDSLGRWLYGVSRRVAAKTRVARDRRRRREVSEPLPERGAGSMAADRPIEALAALDDEVAGLAEPFRSAIILCDLGGMTHEQAALEVGCPVGTIKSRLARGRARLRVRLVRRGIDGSFSMPLAVGATTAPRLVAATVRLAVTLVGTGSAFSPLGLTGWFSLQNGVLNMMFAAPLSWLGGAAIAVALGATGLGYLGGQSGDNPPLSVAEVGQPAPTSLTGTAANAYLKPNRVVSSDSYVVESPDVLTVEVLETLPGRPIAGERLVRPDGKISLGSYGEVYVADLTLPEIKVKIIDQLRASLSPEALGLTVQKDGLTLLVPPPDSTRVFVDVASFNSKVYYVQGDVGRPGRLPCTGNETVLDAINYAGGVRAAANVPIRVRLVRPALKRTGVGEYALPVNYAMIVSGEEMTTNYPIMPGDRVVVWREPKQVDAKAAAKQEQQLQNAGAGFDQVAARLSALRPTVLNPPNEPPTGAGAKIKIPHEGNLIVLPEHIVQPSDKIQVEVVSSLPGRPLTGPRLVRPDGKVSLGYYGEVYAAGLTTNEIKEKVVVHLRQFLTDTALGLTEPKDAATLKHQAATTTAVFVEITADNNCYYVQGDVGSPGRLPITGVETVLDAINFAGGCIPSRKPMTFWLVRPGSGGSKVEQVLPIDYPAIVERGDVTTNYQIMPGDRIIVRHDPAEVKAMQEVQDRNADPEVRFSALEAKVDLILKRLEPPAKP